MGSPIAGSQGRGRPAQPLIRPEACLISGCLTGLLHEFVGGAEELEPHSLGRNAVPGETVDDWTIIA